jgi:hypothetical protein
MNIFITKIDCERKFSNKQSNIFKETKGHQLILRQRAIIIVILKICFVILHVRIYLISMLRNFQMFYFADELNQSKNS